MHISLVLIGLLKKEGDAPGDDANSISHARLEEIKALALDALDGFGPFTFHLANLNAFPAAAFIEAHDDGEIESLAETLKMGCKFEDVVSPPHLTVAYFHSPDGSPAPDELVSAIENYRDWPVGDARVEEVELSLLDLNRDYPAPRPFARIPL